jgi:hypothetical protein
MIEMDLDRETLDCLGLRRVGDDEWTFPRLSLLDALGPAPKAKRARRPTISQIEKETGRVVTAVTVAPDGSRTYALGEKADAPVTLNEWDRALGTHPPQIRQ